MTTVFAPVAELALVDSLRALPENSVVVDGSGRRWSREQWCAATGWDASLVCVLRWVGPGLNALSTDELAERGPLRLHTLPGDVATSRHLLGEYV